MLEKLKMGETVLKKVGIEPLRDESSQGLQALEAIVGSLSQESYLDKLSMHRLRRGDRVVILNPKGKRVPMVVSDILGGEILILTVPGNKRRLRFSEWLRLAWKGLNK